MDDATMLHGPVEGPINAVSLNREGTSIVVAGKNLLKVVSCKEEAPFKELASLKLGKVSTVNISHLDVSWCPVDGDNLIASAVTNGAIALWNLGLQSHRKLDRMFHVHRRTANKVCFHPSDANYLVSGSQDATVVFFDLRKSDPALAFENGTDCVRDIKFARSSQLMFALVDETGSVKFWDIRMPDRPVKLFTAHSGPIFSLDFHPSWRGTMATAGRDKLIKVWNWQIDRPSVLHTVQTIAPVSLIRWRRGREYHIASGSLVLDFSIHVWDVRRPYVPFVSFEGHTGAVTGICWKQDPHKLITSGRDGLLFLRDIKDAARFTDLISPATVAVSCRGEMIAAVSNTALQRSEAKSHSNILGKFGTIATMYKTKGFQAGIREKPTVLLREPHLSSVFVFSQISLDSSVQNVLAQNYASSASREDFSCEYIADCAKRYKLQGGPVDQLCSHNSQVALELGRQNEAYAWLLLSDIHTSGYLSPENVRRFQHLFRSVLRRRIDILGAQKRTEAADEPDSDLSSDFSSENCTDENDVNELLESCSPQCTSRNSCSRDDHFDLWYSWAPRISPAFRSTVGSYDVPKDAFEDTSELKMQEESENVPKLLIPLLEDDFAAVFHELISNRKQKSVCRYVVADPSDFVFLISCMLNYYVEKAVIFWMLRGSPSVMQTVLEFQSDVQMSVTMLIVLGETANGIVSESAVKRWFLAYIDLLKRYQLYPIAALVTNLCPIEEIKADKNQQCTMNILCSRHGHVQSLYVCCPGCLHGGHVAHIEEWFSVHDFCPTGCGHPCEYS
ncbi:WD domain, G-beta repeat protein [Trichuris suis]|nr:WD domain, G-beta repeat protein [Trichuris suis]